MTRQKTPRLRMHASPRRLLLAALVVLAVFAGVLPSPATASFVHPERDPGARKWIIVNNNPLRYTDPLGLWGFSLNPPYQGAPGIGFDITNEGFFVGTTRLGPNGAQFTGGVNIAPFLVDASRNAPAVAANGLPPLMPLGGPTLSGPPGVTSGGVMAIPRPNFGLPTIPGFFAGGGSGTGSGSSGGGSCPISTSRGGGTAPEFPGGRTSQTGFLESAERYLGPGYSERSPGRYVSADQLRQVRFGRHEVSSPVLHGHFEAYEAGRVVENTVVIIDP